MSDIEPSQAFAKFREAVFDDYHLLLRLRTPLARDDYVAQIVAIGAERGFAFDEAAVRAVMREGELTWLMQADEIL